MTGRSVSFRRVSNVFRAGILIAAFIFSIPFVSRSQTIESQTVATNSSEALPPTPKAEPPTASNNQSADQYPNYPGDPQAKEKGKIEATVGAVKFRFYGTVILNTSISDSVEVGQDIPLWALPGSTPFVFPDGTSLPNGHVHDLIFTARQSVFGFTFSPANSSPDHWTPSGVLEFDFFGSRPADANQPESRVFNTPRLRLAYFQLQKGMWKIIAGQDNIIISPLDPISLSHVAVPLGAAAGDLWGRLPQVRLEVTKTFGETTGLLQVGVLRPLFADAKLEALPAAGSALDSTSSGLGERSGQPFYQARVAVSHPMNEQTATVGVAGHFGEEAVGATRDIGSWAFTFDFDVPILSRLILRGEGFVGSNLIPFQGGILQGVTVAPAAAPFTQIRPIGSGGGWGELTFRATKDNKNVFYLGAGTDDPKNSTFLPGNFRAKNSFAWASYFRKLTNDVTLATEWSNWQFLTGTVVGTTETKTPSGRGNVINIALAYSF